MPCNFIGRIVLRLYLQAKGLCGKFEILLTASNNRIFVPIFKEKIIEGMTPEDVKKSQAVRLGLNFPAKFTIKRSKP